MKKKSSKIFALLKRFRSNGRIALRFRNINIALLAVVSILISVVMLFVFKNITNTVSKDFAGLYSANTAGTLNTYFGIELALMKKAGSSRAVTEWLDDEWDSGKKLDAYNEMREIIESLPGDNLYIVVQDSMNEYMFDSNYLIDDFAVVARLEPGNPDDAWYFDCAASEKDYLLNVDTDKILQKKRVWLNYKVMDDGEVLGVISTWLEFSDLVERLFSEYEDEYVRGLVIDENGVVQMDSALLEEKDSVLRYEKYSIEFQFPDDAFLSALNIYLEGINGHFRSGSEGIVIELSPGDYHYATITPINATTWSVVTFYNASSLFSAITFAPLLIVVLAMFVLFIVMSNFASNRLIFEPFKKLANSVAHIKTNYNDTVYGTGRNDEIGGIADTVQDMKDNLIIALEKAHYDSLTGIHNRRYLDETLSDVIKLLSRSGENLSVMMIDIDYFKRYNDTYGHDMGDTCLKKVAGALAGCITRANDFIVRYGGEEFAVILPNTNEKGARYIAGKMLKSVKDCEIPHESSDAASHVTVSIGLTTGAARCELNGEDYIRRADEALYASKNNGRNRVTSLSMDCN